MGLKTTLNQKLFIFMEIWQATIKEVGNEELLKPQWCSSEFDYRRV